MSPQACVSVRFVREIVLAVLCTTVLYVVVEARANAYRRTATSDNVNWVDLLSEGMTLSKGSDVTVRRTPEVVYVQIIHGEVLLKARDLALSPMIVRAGNAQIRDVNAMVCVEMDGDRASIDVMGGTARVANVDGESRVINEVTLGAGDRAEIRANGGVTSFRLARGEEGREDCQTLVGHVG